MHKEEGIIYPRRGKGEPCIEGDVLMVLISGELNRFKERFNAFPIYRFDSEIFHLFKVDKGPYMVGPCLGAPQAVLGLEKMIALGAERIWVYGFCGSIQEDIEIGDIIVPQSSIPEEGTSEHYPVDLETCRTDMEMNSRILEILDKRGLRYHKGNMWSIDAPYRETPSKIRRYCEMGILGVDMELSALITVATFRSVKIAGLLLVSDLLLPYRWKPGFRDKEFKRVCGLIPDIFKDLLLRSWRRDG